MDGYLFGLVSRRTRLLAGSSHRLAGRPAHRSRGDRFLVFYCPARALVLACRRRAVSAPQARPCGSRRTRGEAARWRRRPSCQQCPVQIDAFTSINHGLPVRRQVVGELGNEHMGQQAKAGDATFDRTARRWRLHDGFAAATCQFRAHVAAGWHEFKLLGRIFTKLLQVSTTGWAVCRRRHIHFFITWQMLGQLLARCTLTRRAIGRGHFPFCLGVVGL
jgi:hypothetical protein